MNKIKDKHICGQRGGEPFKSVIRPDQEGNCSEGMTKCSNKTTPDNTICVKDGETDKCPITFFAITASKANVQKSKAAKATVIEYLKVDKKQYFIVFNKTSGNLPIMKTALTVGIPCMTSNQTRHAPKQKLYLPAELDSKK